MSQRPLTQEEARVLAVLVEKQHTVPDSYPMSLNALTLGCNQKTARDPVMNLSETDVLDAINGLKELSLVNEVSGSRVVRFEHNAARGLGVPSQSVALLTMLMLRGPQTTAELRLHTERLHRFVDLSSVDGFLEEMTEREPHRVVKLARAPGAREQRWAHLLCGEVTQSTPIAYVGSASPNQASESELAELREEINALRNQVAQQQADLDTLRAQLSSLAHALGVQTQSN